MIQDASAKPMLSFTIVLTDLLRGFVNKPWLEHVDLSSVEPLKTEHTNDRYVRRLNDRVWKLRKREPASVPTRLSSYLINWSGSVRLRGSAPLGDGCSLVEAAKRSGLRFARPARSIPFAWHLLAKHRSKIRLRPGPKSSHWWISTDCGMRLPPVAATHRGWLACDREHID